MIRESLPQDGSINPIAVVSIEMDHGCNKLPCSSGPSRLLHHKRDVFEGQMASFGLGLMIFRSTDVRKGRLQPVIRSGKKVTSFHSASHFWCPPILRLPAAGCPQNRASAPSCRANSASSAQKKVESTKTDL